MSDSSVPDNTQSNKDITENSLVAGLQFAVETGDRDWLINTIIALHPADAADALEQLGADNFNAAVALLGADMPAEVLIELREELRVTAIGTLPDKAVAQALDELDSDDATAILEDLEDQRRDSVLEELEPADRAALEQGLAFDEDTAGRLMQREFVAAPEFWTVGHAVDHARATGDELPELFFNIYIVDPAFRVTGFVPLATLVRSPREVRLGDIMNPLEVEIRTSMDQEEVAYLFQKYSLVSAPVIDESDRITGEITVDDMVHVIQDENTEDILALSGVSAADGSDTVLDVVRARAPWLAINLFTAFIASGIISIFEPALQQIVALAILMPVVAALGGNAGSQALAVAVRAIAEREMRGKAARRAVRRELLAGIVNGLLFAVGVGLIAGLWFQDIRLAGVIAVAMLVTFIWAGLSGVLVPLTLKRLGADPAVASSVFVLTMTDVLAFLSFLGLATLVLL